MSTITPPLPTSKVSQTSVTVLAVAATIALLYFGHIFFITMVIAITIAFLLDPVVTFFVKMRLPRAVASFIVCSIALLLLYLMGLGLYTELSGLAEALPTYSQRMNDLVDNIATRVDLVEKRTYQILVPKRFQETQPAQGAPPAAARRRGSKQAAEPVVPAVPAPIPEVRIHTEPTPLVTYVYGYLRSFYDVLLMASFVPFLVYFMLSWRDHMRRSFLYMFGSAGRQVVGKSWEGVADMVRAYVIGNFILGLMLSTLSSLFFIAIRLPYWPLVGPLSGFLSLVPYVGLPLAILPPLLAGLIVPYTQPAIYIMITVVVALLHLTALNLLYPKVVGSRVHLNPLVVTIALMFWGTLWGAVGLLLAIPITAAIKAVCDNVISLQGFGKLLGD